MFYQTESDHFLRLDSIVRITPCGEGSNIYLKDNMVPTFSRLAPDQIAELIIAHYRDAAVKAQEKQQELADVLRELADFVMSSPEDEPDPDEEMRSKLEQSLLSRDYITLTDDSSGTSGTITFKPK